MSLIESVPAAAPAGVQAARVAFAIAAGNHSGEPLVLRAMDFHNAHESVRAALEARNAPGFSLRVAEIDAEYGIRGTFLAPKASLGRVDDGKSVAAIISVKSKYEIDRLTQIPVIGELSRALEALADEDGTSVAIAVFVLEKPER